MARNNLPALQTHAGNSPVKVIVRQFSKKFAILEPSVKKTFKGLNGGRGGGKSWAIARKLIALATSYRFHCVCARAYWTNIAESAYGLIVQTISDLGLESEFQVTNNYVMHKRTKARFTFIGLNTNPAGIKSQEFQIIWVEEGEQITQEAWDTLIPTLIRKKGATCICSWNRLLPTTAVELVFADDNPDCVVETIGFEENPHLPQAFLDEAYRMRAKDPRKYEWIYGGGFQPANTETFISLESVMQAIDRGTAACEDKAIVAGLDLGFSRDRSVLVIRQGFRILDVRVWNQPNPRQLVDEVIGICNHLRIQGIGIDRLGPGAPIVNDLTEALGQQRVFPIGYGDPANDSEQFVNLRSEAWGKIKDWLEVGHIPGGHNNAWVTDLCNIRYGYDVKGRTQVEQKKLYCGRGFSSTDLADALGISLCVPEKLAKVGLATSRIDSRPYLDLGY